MNRPTGTITFLFTDIEGSTKLWEQHPQAMRTALARHDVLMHQAISDNNGFVFKTMGDAFCATFATAPQALMAAFTAQKSLRSETWPDPVTVSVRMALHTGTADERDGDYFGPPLNRVARLLSTGYGGQTLLSLPTYELVRDALPSGCTLQDLGAHALRDLARPEQVYQLCHPDLPSEFPPLKSLDSLPNNLPVQLTSFVGRERELTQVKDLLAKTHLLTLTGSGGCGKTRLSLQAAADVLDNYPDGVWLVELAPITDPGLVPQAVAGVLGIKDQPGQALTHTLTDWLKSKNLLLVLDNCEHLLSACAALVSAILRQCPTVRILASSREGLNVTGEQTYRVPSLSLPDAKVASTPENLSQYEAVRLFIDRAMQVKPGFTVTNQNAPALASICHRVDGIPLALELAAARVRSLSVEEINDRLDNQFRLLTGGSRTALPRQQTLRALIDWSYDLLTGPEKSLLCRLSVFAGGWTLAAAEAVCISDEIEDWEVLDLLTSLVDKSLVTAEEIDGQTRYHLLETVRQYARDRLAEGQEGLRVRGRHRDYFLQMAEEIRPKLLGGEQAHWLTVLETEHDNLRQAITFCLEDPDGTAQGLRLGAALDNFWWGRGHLSEGRTQIRHLLAAPGAQALAAERTGALSTGGFLAAEQGDYAEAQALYEQRLGLFQELGNMGGVARALSHLGDLAIYQGDYEKAQRLFEESLPLHREVGAKGQVASTLLGLGRIAWRQGDSERAQPFFEESLTAYQELNDVGAVAVVLTNLGNLAKDRGDYVKAQGLYEESLTIQRELKNSLQIAGVLLNLASIAFSQNDFASGEAIQEEGLLLFREVGHKLGTAMSLCNLGACALEQNHFEEAQARYAEALALYQALGDQRGIAAILDGFARLYAAQGRTIRAVHLWAVAEALRETMGAALGPGDQEKNRLAVSDARAIVGDKVFEAAWAEGRAMSMEQAVKYALGE